MPSSLRSQLRRPSVAKFQMAISADTQSAVAPDYLTYLLRIRKPFQLSLHRPDNAIPQWISTHRPKLAADSTNARHFY